VVAVSVLNLLDFDNFLLDHIDVLNLLNLDNFFYDVLSVFDDGHFNNFVNVSVVIFNSRSLDDFLNDSVSVLNDGDFNDLFPDGLMESRNVDFDNFLNNAFSKFNNGDLDTLSDDSVLVLDLNDRLLDDDFLGHFLDDSRSFSFFLVADFSSYFFRSVLSVEIVDFLNIFVKNVRLSVHNSNSVFRKVASLQISHREVSLHELSMFVVSWAASCRHSDVAGSGVASHSGVS